MFKRLADRVSSAVASVAGAPNSTGSTAGVNQLKSMGFSETDAVRALEVSEGNVERAAEFLLTSGASTNGNMSAVTAQTEQDELDKAISASLEDAAKQQPDTVGTNNKKKSAASVRAGQAALARFQGHNKPNNRQGKKQKERNIPASSSTPNSGGATAPILSHPVVKMPKKLTQHEKEDVILRCAQRIAPHSVAVDTLFKSLKQLQQQPTNRKFHVINTTTPQFQRSLNAPGVIDFFIAMNYNKSYSNPNVLELAMVDPAALYLGISALEQVQRESQEYNQSKSRVEFEKALKSILGLADSDMQEALKRSQFMAKLPSEPAVGGGQITVEMASTKISRKFDGDDTLQDILHWLGAHGSTIPEKLKDKQWFLTDRSHANVEPYDCVALSGKTLQYIGCWPSGRLSITPIPPVSERTPTSSRGLGAAPMDALK